MIDRRRKGALLLSALWIFVALTMLYFMRDKDLNLTFWAFFLVSLTTAILGIAVYLGTAKLLAGLNTMSDEELSTYNIEKITSFMGVILFLVSLLFLSRGFLYTTEAEWLGAIIWLAIICVLIFAVIYVNFRKTFRESSQY